MGSRLELAGRGDLALLTAATPPAGTDRFASSGLERAGNQCRRVKTGATCTFRQLLQYDWPPHWPGIRALCEGMASLASFKVAHLATIGGNLCLALSVGVVAPVLIALEATYTLIDLQGSLRHIPAQDFQIGPQQTLLQPGEALRSIWIPAQRLRGPSTFQRLGITQTDPALVIVAGSRDPDSGNYRFGLNAALSPP